MGGMDPVEVMKRDAAQMAAMRLALLRVLPFVVAEVEAIFDAHGPDGAGSFLASLMTTCAHDIAKKHGLPGEAYANLVAHAAHGPADIRSVETISVVGRS